MGSSETAPSHRARLNIQENPARYPLYYTAVRPVEGAPPLPDATVAFAWDCVEHIDLVLEVFADTQSHSFVSRLVSKEETQQVQNDIIAEVLTTLYFEEDTRAFPLLFGMQPVLLSMNEELPLKNRRQLVPIRIQGYSSEGAVKATLITPISPEDANARIKFGVDDVFDTGHELALLLCEIEEKMFGFTDRSIVELMHNLEKKPFEELRHLYDEIIPRFHKAGLVISVLSYKNIPFIEQLHSYLSSINEPDEWCRHQDEMLNHTIELDQDDWGLGSGMDAGKKGEYIVNEIKLRNLLPDWVLAMPKIQTLLESLRNAELRIGAQSEGILCVDNKKAFDDFVISEFAFFLEQYASAIHN